MPRKQDSRSKVDIQAKASTVADEKQSSDGRPEAASQAKQKGILKWYRVEIGFGFIKAGRGQRDSP